MMTPRIPAAAFRLSTSRWLGIGLALLAGSFPLHAQVHPAPGFDLFGDEVVKKLPIQNGVVIIPGDDFRQGKANQTVPGFAHALIFQDGTQVRGEIVALTKEEILWSRPDVSEPLRFRRDSVRRIVLTSADSYMPRLVRTIPREQIDLANKMKSGFATVKLSGGDWLHGELSSTDGQSFNLRLDDQTNFTIQRDSIAWLHSGPEPVPAFGFSGGSLDMEGWLAHNPGAQMEVKDGTLTVSGADWIGRQMAPLRRFELSFELPADAEDGTQIWLQPYGPAVNSYTRGTIEMRLGRRAFQHCIFVNRMDHVSTPLPRAAAKDDRPVRYRILYDGQGERLVVIRNGRQLGEWKFSDEKDRAVHPRFFQREFSISAVCFQRRAGRSRPLQLNQVQFLPWDGTLSQDAATGEGDSLLSLDGKSRAGRLESLSSDELQFSGDKVERKSGTFLRFAQEPTPLTNAGAVLLFGNQGEVSTADLEIRDGKASFRTGFAPALETPVANLQTIAFPPHTQASGETSSDILVFKNGDEIPGFLVSAAQGEPWRWQTAGGQEVAIQPGHIAGVRSLAGGIAPASQAGTSSTVEFRNGDRLRGELAGFQDGRVQLRHREIGAFTLAPSHLWALYPNPSQSVTDGAQHPAKWMGLDEEEADDESDFGYYTEPSGSKRWIYLDGHYIMPPEHQRNSYSTASLTAPRGERPERFELRFNVTGITGSQPNFNVTLTADQGDGRLRAQILGDNFYANIFSRKARRSRSKQTQIGGRVAEPTSRRNVRVFVDTKAGTADFFLDGILLARMGQQDTERLPGLGEGIQLQANSHGGPVIFSNIWIGPWNGEAPQAASEQIPTTSLTNGDIAEGAPTAFHDGKITLDTVIGPVDVPLERLQAIEFGGAMSPKPTAARVRLADGSTISVDAFRWEGTQFVGQNEALGDFRIPAKLITELVLAPAPPRAPVNPPAKQKENHGR